MSGAHGLLLTAMVGLDDIAVERRLTGLIDAVLDGRTALLLALVVAAGVGAVHALAPGHGKVLVGAWLVGGHGRPRDAFALGVLVGVMHTASVLVLGLLVVGLGRAPASTRWPDTIVAVTGLAVAAVGLRALARRRRHVTHTAASTTRTASPHAHHHHVPAGVAPTSRAGIAALAASGGLVPSPGALAMLATAVALGRPLAGLLLVVVFGLGLGATLSALGLVVLRGHEAIQRRAADPDGWASRIAARLPTVSAATVVVAGLVIAGAAFDRLIAAG